MSVTTRCKTVSISGRAGFAIVRALRQRLEILITRRNALDHGDTSQHGIEIRSYVHSQIVDVYAALDAMSGADFALVEGMKS